MTVSPRMDSAKEWCAISRALQIITGELRSAGRAQARLIEACAAGNIRSRVLSLPLVTDAGAFSMDSAVINFVRRAGPVPALTWKGAVIDGDALLDRSRRRWSPVEINVRDLRFDLFGAEPSAPASVPASTGGRPSDKKSVKAEAERSLKSGDRPPTLAAFARNLHKWLDAQPDAIRNKAGNVMLPETIKDHVRPLWNSYRRKAR